MRYISFILIVFIAMCNTVNAQEKWDLRKIVDYAIANNITVKQAEVQAGISQLVYKQSKLGLYPSASLSGNMSYNNGPSQDASFNLINQGYLGSGIQLQTSADIFNWYSKKNTLLANQWEFEAAKASTDKLKNDIALTVANNYLQILLTREQENIAQVQLKQTQAQLSYTRKLVNAGSLPELNASELEAQEARDSANFISARGSVVQATLVLKSNMNIDAAAPFEVVQPPVELIPIEKIADLYPDDVYALAVVNLPQQKVNDFKLRAAQKSAAAAKGNLYPTISAFGNLGTGFNSRTNEITGFSQSIDTIGTADVNGLHYPVTRPSAIPKFGKSTFFNQYSQNFRQSVGIGISVPIFNGAQLRTNWERSKLNIRNVELQKEGDNQKIKQDIYQAYNAAIVALEKFSASEKSVAASQRTYDFAQKRYAVGMLSTFELITNQNNLFRAKLEMVLNQFDYVFKMKVLEFYRGQGLKL
ncbi:MAG: TolC family protein [Ferruginibacter sp.]